MPVRDKSLPRDGRACPDDQSQTNSIVTGPWEYKAKLVYTGNPARRGESRTPLWAASIM